jgi:protein-tyrosine-phosphatase
MNLDRAFKILFLCTGNSARSVFGEYLIRRLGKGKFESFSAIRVRHLTRLSLPRQPVPRVLVEEALALAVHAPSNSGFTCISKLFDLLNPKS